MSTDSAAGELKKGEVSGHVRVAVVGAGFAGLGVAAALQREGFSFAVLERRADVGGTWRDNSYPGCQCDVPSHLYSFSFAPNPEWSRTYSSQPEIWAYLRRCAEDLDLLRRIRFNCEVSRASWHEAQQRWNIETTAGRLTADVLVSGNGALSEPSIPPIPGLDRFEGTRFHSASWNHSHGLDDEVVAVVGTGASAIQIVPRIQPQVRRLLLFQRTPAWVLPHTDRPVTHLERRLYRRFPVLQRVVRAGVYCGRELVAVGMTKRPALMRPIRRLATAHMRRQIKDPGLREELTPQYSPGCKRLLPSDDFYPALNAHNVELVTERIDEVRPRGIVTADGKEHAVDTIIFGTGFHVTDNPIAEKVHGRGGRSLAEAWRHSGAQAYLGTTVPGFPNLFLMTGPNTGIGYTSLVYMIESQIPYITGCLRTMAETGAATVEVRDEVHEAFNDEVQWRMGRTVWSAGGCASWYVDDRGRNTTLWPDFTWKYRLRTRRFDVENYSVTRRADRAQGPGSGVSPLARSKVSNHTGTQPGLGSKARQASRDAR
jgi:cation diffusion facilitator CzcD-associated flavoprotein CzcO